MAPVTPKSKQQGRCKEFFRLAEGKALSVHSCMCARMLDLRMYTLASWPFSAFSTSYQHLISFARHIQMLKKTRGIEITSVPTNVNMSEEVPVILLLSESRLEALFCSELQLSEDLHGCTISRSTAKYCF